MEHNSFSTDLLIKIVCTAFVAGLAIYAISRKNKKSRKNRSKKDSRSSGRPATETTPPKPVPTVEPKPEPEPQPTSVPKQNPEPKEEPGRVVSLSVALIAPYVRKFGSSIGVLWQVSKVGNEDETGSMAFDNLDMVIASIDSPELKKEWKTFTNDRFKWDDSLYTDKASELLSVLEGAGVEICAESRIVWNDKSAIRYRKFLKVEEGDECEVLNPCAIYDGIVIEQGLVRKFEK